MTLIDRLRKLPPRAWLLIAAVVVIGLGGGVWAYKRGHGKGPNESAPAEGTDIVRREGKIFIPRGSPYRARITVAPVQQKSISRSKLVTGTVEADPTRTVKILAPVAGRVADLSVSLGDTVKKGQRLATIDSGDLAQLVADAEKARATVKLTKSAMERATGLNKAGGLALKELEQAQNDDRQATSELKRAEARLEVMQVISQLLEADTRRNKVRISFDNPYGLFKLNMFASVRFFAPAAQSILVPSSALFIVNDTTSVFLEVAPWTFQRKPVVIDSDYEGSTIVRGLEPGQRIVVAGGVLLND